ncbi:MAG: M16 family metallopeptidase, partial [Anaerolineae bacterium]
SFGAGRHTTRFHAKCLSEDLADVLETLAEMLTSPAFPDAQVELVRGQIATAIKQRQSSTRHRSAVAFRELAYGTDHPYGRDTDGTADSIAAVSRSDLVAYYERALHPSGGIVALVGAAPAAAALDALSRTIGAWQPGGAPPERLVVQPPPDAGEVRRDDVLVPGKSQSDIVLGNAAIAREHPDWLATAVANAVLGVFGLMGRLGENVRDKRGLAYYAFSRLAGGQGPGPWFASAGVNPANVDEAIEATLHEMRRLRDEPVPDAELEDVNSYISGSLPLQLETNGGVAGALLDIAQYDLGLDYLQRFPSLVAAVTADDVQRAAQAHLHPDAAAIAVAGPES